MNWSLYQSLISNFDGVAILQEKLAFFVYKYTYLALV